MRVAISGIGIGGPTLAYWLRRSGHQVLLVENSPSLRSGGYVVDFWGVGYDIAEKMGLIPEIQALGYRVEDVRFLNRHGRKSGGFSVGAFRGMTNGRFTSIRRSDLAASIHRALDGSVETIFGDSIAKIEPGGDRHVRLDFEHAAAREVDLVVGADGMHSRVRRLAFGDQAAFEVSLGYHVAAFEVSGYRPRHEGVYVAQGVPGRQVARLSMRDDKTLFLFVFRDEYLEGDEPSTTPQRKAALASIYGNVGAEAPRILAAMADVGDVYFDRVSQIRMDSWSKGRTVLIGDAAACVSLMAGEGTGLAMAEAYVLAGELRRWGADYSTAFARYQDCLMPLVKRKQSSAAKFASSFAPRTAPGLVFRNLVSRLLNLPILANLIFGRDLRDEITLPHYKM